MARVLQRREACASEKASWEVQKVLDSKDQGCGGRQWEDAAVADSTTVMRAQPSIETQMARGVE